ncbi:MAG: glycoside hydrolase domain-containing protein [Bacteroides cellulosilyticus]
MFHFYIITFGAPWKTQKLVHQILLELTTNYYGTHEKWEKPYIGKIFNTTPQGYLKEMDDDAGTMSSWFVLSSIGLYFLSARVYPSLLDKCSGL